jgi:ABC-type amino acid transport system permease subunit
LVIYFVLAQAINLAMRLLERRLNRGVMKASL